MPRRGANACIDFNTELEITRSEGRTAQLVLTGFTFVFYPGTKPYNKTNRKDALTTVLSAVGLLQRIEVDEDEEEAKPAVRHNLIRDVSPRVNGRRRSIH